MSLTDDSNIPNSAVFGLYMQDGVIYLVHPNWTRPKIEVDVMSTIAARPDYGPAEADAT